MRILTFQLKMLSFVFFLNVCVIQVHRVESRTTHRDKYLVGPVIERLNAGDWMQCLIACTTSDDCVSYNFEPRSGTCEHLSEGLDLGRNCHGRKFLVRSQGWIFHQITDTFWSPWNQWSNCGCIEGDRKQKRNRTCISSSNGECSGERSETKPCYDPTLPCGSASG
ncbi:thrombospondin-1-like [Orbicella faveolata]|uniref:thrombospondin-1-like n=1 Tax=Orbicella faveolata TaxID=48498 RepID=UPI0009E2C3D5|nr:thrombospondin-1-like [Orbicella faveolata]